MILSKAPLRLSIIGGGLDHEDFYSEFPTQIMTSAFNSFVYFSVLQLPPFADEKIRFNYRRTESVGQLDELQHPTLREIIRILKIDTPLNMSTFSNLPSRYGLGGSSSFCLASLKALSKFSNKKLSKYEMMQLAIKVERGILMEGGGIQDQIAAAFGGVRIISASNKGIKISPDIFTKKDYDYFKGKVFLIPLSATRDEKRTQKEKSLKVENYDKYIEYAKEIIEMANTLKNIDNPRKKFEFILSSIKISWDFKIEYTNFNIPEGSEKVIQNLIENGIKYFKIMGSGEAGAIVFFRNNKKINIDSLKLNYPHLMNIELEKSGARIIYSGIRATL